VVPRQWFLRQICSVCVSQFIIVVCVRACDSRGNVYFCSQSGTALAELLGEDDMSYQQTCRRNARRGFHDQEDHPVTCYALFSANFESVEIANVVCIVNNCKQVQQWMQMYFETWRTYCSTPCLRKNWQNYFCYNYVKLPPNLTIFGTKMAKSLKLYEVLSFTSLLNADVPNCYITV